jgi:hypothetical protein
VSVRVYSEVCNIEGLRNIGDEVIWKIEAVPGGTSYYYVLKM